ncbi:MAG: hypothetical protein R3E89_09305 [Thiolinea sp.]
MPRHVVGDDSSRTFPFAEQPLLPELANITTLAEANSSPVNRQRETLQSQIVAKSLALGDLTRCTPNK